MENSKKIHFITYSNNVFDNAKKRLLNQANRFYPFTSISGYGPNDLPLDFKQKFENILKMKRGAGYWIWKPIIIYRKLQEIAENEYLIYLDAGFNINNSGLTRFNEYIDLLDNSEYGLISFKLPHIEKNWTTQEIFNYFNVDLTNDIRNSEQFVNGISIIKKNEHSLRLYELYMNTLNDNPYLFTDFYNKTQCTDFKDNRHDQSVFSVLRKLHNTIVLNDETWMIPFGRGESLKYPFWATRAKN